MAELASVKKEPVKADPAAFETEKTFKLSRPLRLTGEAAPSVREIKLRYPNGGDLFALELPYRSFSRAGEIEVKFNGQALADWIERLSDKRLGRNELETMSAKDARTIYDWIVQETNPGNLES